MYVRMLTAAGGLPVPGGSYVSTNTSTAHVSSTEPQITVMAVPKLREQGYSVEHGEAKTDKKLPAPAKEQRRGSVTQVSIPSCHAVIVYLSFSVDARNMRRQGISSFASVWVNERVRKGPYYVTRR